MLHAVSPIIKQIAPFLRSPSPTLCPYYRFFASSPKLPTYLTCLPDFWFFSVLLLSFYISPYLFKTDQLGCHVQFDPFYFAFSAFSNSLVRIQFLKLCICIFHCSHWNITNLFQELAEHTLLYLPQSHTKFLQNLAEVTFVNHRTSFSCQKPNKGNRAFLDLTCTTPYHKFIWRLRSRNILPLF